MNDDVIRRPVEQSGGSLRRRRAPVLARINLRQFVRVGLHGTPSKHHIRSGDPDSRTQQIPAEYPLAPDRDHPRSAIDRQRSQVITESENVGFGRFTWNDG